MKKVQFGHLIRDYRQKKGWTQAELARELGYETPQFISLLERDQSKAPLYVLGQLIVLLGIPEVEITTTLMDHFQEDLRQQILEGKRIAARREA